MAELKQYREDLDTTEDPNEVLQILANLQDVTVSLDTLKTSQLGLTVGNLKKKFASNKKIVDVSKKLIADWKASCVPGTGTPSKSPSNSKQTPTKKVEEKIEKEEKPEKKVETTPTSDKKRKLSNTSFEEPKKKPVATPSLSLSVGDERDKIRIILTEALGDAEEDDAWAPVDAGTTIENELMRIYGSANKDYKAKVRSLSFNLKKNNVLRRDVLNGSLTAEKLCRMTAGEMASEEEQQRRRATEKWHLEAATIGKMEASTDQFLCGKCKNRKCTYYQLQTRSADEPMTTFVTCTVCNNRWKFC